MTLNFKEWDSLNESNIFDRIKNWLSGTFGGKIEKLDKLASEYKSAELEYVEEWENVQIEMDKLELEKSQTKNDPAELKKINRLIERNHQLMDAQTKAHEKKTDEIFNKVRESISDNKRIKTYWERLKLKIDAEIAEEMYKRAKNLADSSLSGTLYSKYKAALLKAKQKDIDFKNKYGDLMDKDIESSYKYREERGKKKYRTDVEAFSDDSDFTFEFLAKLSISEFTDAVKDYPSDKMKKLVSFLIKERNDRYVAMDMERDVLGKEVDNAKNKSEAKIKATEKMKSVREKYMSEIRDLRSKITIARKYA